MAAGPRPLFELGAAGAVSDAVMRTCEQASVEAVQQYVTALSGLFVITPPNVRVPTVRALARITALMLTHDQGEQLVQELADQARLFFVNDLTARVQWASVEALSSALASVYACVATDGQPRPNTAFVPRAQQLDAIHRYVGGSIVCSAATSSAQSTTTPVSTTHVSGGALMVLAAGRSVWHAVAMQRILSAD